MLRNAACPVVLAAPYLGGLESFTAGGPQGAAVPSRSSGREGAFE